MNHHLIAVRCPLDIFERLKQEQKREKRSMSNLAWVLMEEALDARENERIAELERMHNASEQREKETHGE